jgi:hypothetical protein
MTRTVAETDRRGLDRRHRPRPDQHVGLQRGRGQGHEMQPLDAAPDEAARRRHGDAAIFRRHDDHGAVGNDCERLVEVAQNRVHIGLRSASPGAFRKG